MEFFEIQVASGSNCSFAAAAECTSGQNDNEVSESSDGVEIIDTPIKSEILSSDEDEQQMGIEEGISTSCQPFNELETEPIDANDVAPHHAHNKSERLSFDPNLSMGQRSTCSSIASNATPIAISPIFEYVKREPAVDVDVDCSFASNSTSIESKDHRGVYKRQLSTEPSNVSTKRPKIHVSINPSAEQPPNSPDSGRRFILKRSIFHLRILFKCILNVFLSFWTILCE